MLPGSGRWERLLPVPGAANLIDVLADQGSPQPSVEANRAQRSSRKKKTSPALLIIPLVLAVAAVTLFLLLRGGDGTGLPFIGGGDDDVPAFDFTVKKAKVVSTSEEADTDTLTATATGIGKEIAPILDDMFTAAFLDPSNWRDGDYEEVFAAFDDAARPSAEESVETLTLGMSAGDHFESVKPTKGGFSYRVLFSPEGEPNTVVVTFRFYALGEGTDGTYTSIVSHGQLFMRNEGGWKITAFSVKRNDQEAEAPAPTPSGSGSTPASS